MHRILFPHTRVVLTAFFVTFLWSTSWVLIKVGLQDIPPLTFAGLRYFGAFLLLLALLRGSSPGGPQRPFPRRRHEQKLNTMNEKQEQEERDESVFSRSIPRSSVAYFKKSDWLGLAGLGLLIYAIAPGSQFLGLVYLPAITFSLLLNGTAVLVAVLGIPLLREWPTRLQWGGMLIFLGGVLIFFHPWHIPAAQGAGYVIAAVHLLAISFASILGRGINRRQRLHPLLVTTISMGIGATLLLGTGLALEPWPRLGWGQWGIVLWLAVVNTAVAFTLWNYTLRTLSAMESVLINNTMLIQISLLAWLFLGERLTGLQVGALALAALGALLAQWRPRRPAV